MLRFAPISIAAPAPPPLGEERESPCDSPGFQGEKRAIPQRWHPGLRAATAACRHVELFAPGDDASGAALALALADDATDDPTDHRAWLWVQDKAAIRLSGRPYRPGLPARLRHRLIHVAADRPEDALFALEEALRCRDLAFVIGEIAGNPAALTFTTARRLSLVAQRHGVPLWLVRLAARHDPGSARMRWDVAAAPSPPPRWNRDAPGDPRWRADLFRAHVFQPGQWTLGHDSFADPTLSCREVCTGPLPHPTTQR